ncbi:MAG: ABC transporter substrate-binding protein [Bacteroidales bacterium]|nr:ABC transporter substrate-binding protein [Bacteroidales bacterium]
MRSNNPKKNLRAILFTFSILLFSCSNKSEKEETRTVFRYNESQGITSLDPAYARNQVIIWPVNQLFCGLVQLGDSLSIKPCIAKSWEIMEDGKCYRFYLRDDVYFHDHELFKEGKGRRVVASDFVYSLNRIIDPKIASPGTWIFNNVDKEHPNTSSGFCAPNDTVFEIYLKQPFPAFLGILTMPYCFVVPQEVVDEYGDDFGRNPIGTGPFQFKLWKDGEKLVFIKNPHYFEKDGNGNTLPYLDAVAITFVNDKQSEFLEFMKGNLDFLNSVNKAYKDDLITRAGNLNPEYDDKIIMMKTEYLNTEYLGFLLDTSKEASKLSPVGLKAVRQAINFGFDRAKMMKYLRNNIGVPALKGFIPKGLPSYTESIDGYRYDPDYARKLLRDAGYPNGEGLSTINLTTTSDYLDLCEYIQHELSLIGIKIEIEVSTQATYRSNLADSRLSFFRGSWIADYPDAENYLALFYSPNFCPAGPNYTHFKNEEFDRLYEKAMLEINENIRQEYYRQMNQIILDEAVVVPLFYDQVVRFTHKNIEGLGSNPLNLLVLKNVKKTSK